MTFLSCELNTVEMMVGVLSGSECSSMMAFSLNAKMGDSLMTIKCMSLPTAKDQHEFRKLSAGGPGGRTSPLNALIAM